jgi:hypothetical protein
MIPASAPQQRLGIVVSPAQKQDSSKIGKPMNTEELDLESDPLYI